MKSKRILINLVKIFQKKKIQELAQSIKENGLIQPIIVRQSPVIGYEILAGERRYRASIVAGLSEVPVIVKIFLIKI